MADPFPDLEIDCPETEGRAGSPSLNNARRTADRETPWERAASEINAPDRARATARSTGREVCFVMATV